jgi:BirA family transcriptional regulator, biotin operon repressor / biotin---[acetyl-CoA-carboxylase] ligase
MATFVDSVLIPGVARSHASDIGSTNTEALARAKAGATGPLWITADRQFGGRARSGRDWTSPDGNLIASLLVTRPCTAAVAHHLALLAGVALVDAIGDTTVRPSPTAPLILKWPNDILIGGAKVSGILAESTTHAPGHLTAVIGFGVNIAAQPSNMDRAVTALHQHVPTDARPPTADDLLLHLARHMEQWLSVWNCGKGFDDIKTAWLARAGALGQSMSVHIGTLPRKGNFAGLDTDGALLLDDERGVRHRITYGDVTLEPDRLRGERSANLESVNQSLKKNESLIV